MCVDMLCLRPDWWCVESVAHVFEAMYTRLPAAPKAIISDRGCTLDIYSKKREPLWFFNTYFFVDEFHRKSNHTSCGNGYAVPREGRSRIFNIPDDTALLDVNTSTAEQWNRFLKFIAKSAAWMTQSHFMFYFKMYIVRQNYIVRENSLL